MRHKTLLEVLPQWATGGFFAKLYTLFDVPWESEVQAAVLDLDYIGGESGEKNISPLVSRMLDEDGELDDTGVASLARVIWARFGNNWSRIWEVLTTDYEPLENYNMKEIILEAEGTERKPNTETESEIISETKEAETGIYGFNSSESVPANTSNEETNGKRTSKETGDEKTSRLNNRNTNRSGNIGVTTSQQMAESEIALRRKQFFRLVYQDMDEVLTLPIYCQEVRYYDN